MAKQARLVAGASRVSGTSYVKAPGDGDLWVELTEWPMLGDTPHPTLKGQYIRHATASMAAPNGSAGKAVEMDALVASIGGAVTLKPLSISAASFVAGAAAGTLIGTITGKTAGSTLSISPNDGRLAFNGDQSALAVGLTASSAGSANYAVIETLAGATNSGRSTPVTITVSAVAISLTMLNGQQPNGMSVETWRGRHLAMVSTTLSNATITASDSEARFSTQGRPGEPHLLQQWGLDVGPVGTKRSVTFTATNGTQSISRTVEIETKPFVMDPARYAAFFDYTDASTLTLDANGRVIKAVDKLNGHIREHAGGYADLAPGTTAPVFDAATKRMRLTRASGQYLRLAPDAVNDDLRALTGPMNAKFSHIVIGIPSSVTANQHMVSYLDALGNVKTAMRWQPGSPAQFVSLIATAAPTGDCSPELQYGTGG